MKPRAGAKVPLTLLVIGATLLASPLALGDETSTVVLQDPEDDPYIDTSGSMPLVAANCPKIDYRNIHIEHVAPDVVEVRVQVTNIVDPCQFADPSVQGYHHAMRFDTPAADEAYLLFSVMDGDPRPDAMLVLLTNGPGWDRAYQLIPEWDGAKDTINVAVPTWAAELPWTGIWFKGTMESCIPDQCPPSVGTVDGEVTFADRAPNLGTVSFP